MTASEQREQLMLEIERMRRKVEEKEAFEAFERVRTASQRKIHILSTVAVLGIAIGSNFLFEYLKSSLPLIDYVQSFFSSYGRIVGYVTVLVGVLGAFTYLQPSSSARSKSVSERELASLRYTVQRQLDELREGLEGKFASESHFTESDKSKVLASIQAKLESEALHSYVAGMRELMTTNLARESVERLFGSIADRLGREVQDQAKRGNLNLILGIFTTLIGLTVLGYSVFYAPANQSVNEIFAYFVPRVSLVVLIEVFAYFFLRLYKQSLAEIKYFQNEITNIESRQLAIQFAGKRTETDVRLRIVDELMKTERNFLMNKEQTTVDLERERLARTSHSELLNSLKDIVKRKD